MAFDEVLVGPRGITLRRVRPADTDALRDVLHAPEVARWWGSMSEDELRDDVVAPPAGTTSLAIEKDGAFAGLLQIVEDNTPAFRSAGIDIALSPSMHGQGIGPDAIRTACHYLFDALGHHRATIDPRADNVHAIAAYEKVGFRPVGVLREYELTDDGVQHDALFMDLLARELT